MRVRRVWMVAVGIVAVRFVAVEQGALGLRPASLAGSSTMLSRQLMLAQPIVFHFPARVEVAVAVLSDELVWDVHHILHLLDEYPAGSRAVFHGHGSIAPPPLHCFPTRMDAAVAEPGNTFVGHVLEDRGVARWWCMLMAPSPLSGEPRFDQQEERDEHERWHPHGPSSGRCAAPLWHLCCSAAAAAFESS